MGKQSNVFPETEKLMLLSNIFEVSIDSLLKDSESTGTQSTDVGIMSVVKKLNRGFTREEFFS